MTKTTKTHDRKHCSDCREYQRIYKTIGRCYCGVSKHFGHVIDQDHPACKEIV